MPATFFTRSLPLRKFFRFTARSRILFSSSMSAMPSVSASARNLLLHDLVRHQHFVRRELVIERQRRAVLDALGDGILVEITLVVLAAEGLERPLAIDRFVHRRAGEADERRVGQAGHQEVAQVAARRAVRLVNEHVDVLPQVQVRGHVAELVDHRHDDAPVILPQQPVQLRDAAGVRHVGQADRREILEHLIFQLVAVDHQQDGRLLRLGRFEEHLRRLDHRVGLAAALRVPDQPARQLRVERPRHHLVRPAHLMLPQDELLQFLFFLREQDEILEQAQHLRHGAEALHLGFEIARLARASS